MSGHLTEFQAAQLIEHAFTLSDAHTREAGRPVISGLEDWVDSLADHLARGGTDHTYWYKELYGRVDAPCIPCRVTAWWCKPAPPIKYVERPYGIVRYKASYESERSKHWYWNDVD